MADNPYQAPRAAVADQKSDAEGERLELRDILLSMEGRIPRKVFWLYGMLPIVVGALIVAVIESVTNLKPWLSTIYNLALIWPALAITVKRWHDRDKSGWWVLLNIVPILGPIWALVENGFLRGTEGENRFGGDPTDLY